MAIENELKFDGGVPSGKLNVPPKSCIPRRAKIRMKRKSSNSNEIMDFMELSKDTTRLRREDQYLEDGRRKSFKCTNHSSRRESEKPTEEKAPIHCFTYEVESTYTVTLKILNSLKARRTERPNEPDFGLKWVSTTSNTLPEMTRQSNRLKDDSK